MMLPDPAGEPGSGRSLGAGVLRRVAARMLQGLIMVWAVTTCAFFIERVLPADPARMIAGPQARPADVARIRSQLALDRPVIGQYRLFLTRLVHTNSGASAEHATCTAFGPLHLDLGKSYQQRRPVVTILGERLPRTVALAVAAVLVQLWLGITAGVVAASRKGGVIDHAAVTFSLLASSTPTFLIGLGLQLLFARALHWLPIDGYGTTLAEHAVCLVLPAFTLGIFGAAYCTRIVRDEMVSRLRQDAARTARAKGASRLRVLVVHGLRSALLPVVTAVGLDLGALLGGAVVTEQLFRWPGLGSLAVAAIVDRDGPVVLGTVIVAAAAMVGSTMIVDGLYRFFDPRI